jgi:hypothetical protein
MQVTKNLLESFYTISKLEEHTSIKNDLLSLIDSEPVAIKSSDPTNSITKVDWESATNPNRPWTQILSPILINHLDQVGQTLGYKGCKINELWYQQYIYNDRHGWHVHGSNFTGVYYLELPENSPITEMVPPYEQNQIVNPVVEEGSILVFPSYTIHRAPIMQDNLRKTIISFNFDLYGIKPDVINFLNKRY